MKLTKRQLGKLTALGALIIFFTVGAITAYAALKWILGMYLLQGFNI